MLEVHNLVQAFVSGKTTTFAKIVLKKSTFKNKNLVRNFPFPIIMWWLKNSRNVKWADCHTQSFRFVSSPTVCKDFNDPISTNEIVHDKISKVSNSRLYSCKWRWMWSSCTLSVSYKPTIRFETCTIQRSFVLQLE